MLRTPLATTLASITLLAACGGGGGGGGGDEIVNGPVGSYERIDDGGNRENRLGGFAITGGEEDVDLARLRGTFDGRTGAVSVSGGRVSLTDSDGADADGRLVDDDDPDRFAVFADDAFFGIDDFAVVGAIVRDTGGVDDEASLGVIGITTDRRDLPTSGTATYTGGTEASWASIGGAQQTLRGSSRIVSNFDTERVNVTLDFDQVTDRTFTASSQPAVDRITMRGMEIDGNTFRGGTIRTFDDGDTAIGSVEQAEAGGTFFGYDAGIDAPDEAGGAFVVRGETEAIFGVFAGD